MASPSGVLLLLSMLTFFYLPPFGTALPVGEQHEMGSSDGGKERNANGPSANTSIGSGGDHYKIETPLPTTEMVGLSDNIAKWDEEAEQLPTMQVDLKKLMKGVTLDIAESDLKLPGPNDTESEKKFVKVLQTDVGIDGDMFLDRNSESHTIGAEAARWGHRLCTHQIGVETPSKERRSIK